MERRLKISIVCSPRWTRVDLLEGVLFNITDQDIFVYDFGIGFCSRLISLLERKKNRVKIISVPSGLDRVGFRTLLGRKVDLVILCDKNDPTIVEARDFYQVHNVPCMYFQ